MQVGVHFMNFTLPSGPAGLRAAVGDTAVAAEEAGCTVFTAMDHWFQMEHFSSAFDPMLEGYSVLNFVAAKSERLQLVANRGAAFGIGSGHETVVAVVSLVLIIALGVWAVRASTAAERIGAWLAVGGGLGNLLDRVIRPPGGLHGAVTDWIHVFFYGPTFNLADVWLRGGLLIAVIGWLWSRRTGPPSRRTDE